MADIRKGAVTLKGNPVDLAGAALTAGPQPPNSPCRATDLKKSHSQPAPGKFASSPLSRHSTPPSVMSKQRNSTNRPPN